MPQASAEDRFEHGHMTPLGQTGPLLGQLVEGCEVWRTLKAGTVAVERGLAPPRACYYA